MKIFLYNKERILIPNINLTSKTILVTGVAGFIGSNLVTELMNTVEPVTIVGLDNMNDYYDLSIKEYGLRHKLVFAIQSPTRMYISNPISLAFIISSKPVVRR